MTLQMNATFLKVLKEVLLSLPITKPNVKRGNGRIRSRRLGTKRVLSQSKFALRCHTQSIRKKKKHTHTHTHITTRTRERKEYVCMKYA